MLRYIEKIIVPFVNVRRAELSFTCSGLKVTLANLRKWEDSIQARQGFSKEEQERMTLSKETLRTQDDR